MSGSVVVRVFRVTYIFETGDDPRTWDIEAADEFHAGVEYGRGWAEGCGPAELVSVEEVTPA